MPHGGVGTLVQAQATSLARRGHRVTVVGMYAIDKEAVTEEQGVRIVRLPHTTFAHTGFLLNQRRLRAALLDLNRRWPIDIVEGQEDSFGLSGRSFPARRILRMNGGHRFFATTLGQRPRPWRSWIERRSFAAADHICAVSHFVADTTSALLQLDTRQIRILPNFVDTETFRPQPGIPEEENLIVFLGTLCEKKGVRQLVAAMPEIARQVPGVRLHIYGRDTTSGTPPRPFSEVLRALVPSTLQDRVVFKGMANRATVPHALATASVVALPSHMEALPLAWLEAMSSGKAVVASHTGPGPEVIQDGASGLLCDPHDVSAIARRLVEALGSRTLRQSLGERARQRVLEKFSETVMMRENELFYRECLGYGT